MLIPASWDRLFPYTRGEGQGMQITEAIKHMCEQSGKGVVGASQALGKSRMYLSALISRGSYPRTDTLVQIAQACGYKVELVRDGERIELEAE